MNLDESLLYVWLATEKAWYTYDVNSGAKTAFLSTSSTYTDIAFLPGGTHALVVDANLLYRVEIATAIQTLVLGRVNINMCSTTSSLLGNANRLELSHDNTILAVYANDCRTVFRVDLSTFAMSTYYEIPYGLSGQYLSDMAFGPDDSYLLMLVNIPNNLQTIMTKLDLATLQITAYPYTVSGKAGRPTVVFINSVTTCAACDSGRYCDGNSNAPCPAGSYCQASSTQQVCPAQYYCPSGVTTPISCTSGMYCPTGTSAQHQCQQGSYCSSTNTQTACSLGSYCPSGSISQTQCSAGYVCSSPSSQTACSLGSFCPAGTSVETLCQAGAYCPSPSTWIVCDLGSYCPSGSYAQNACPQGYYCPGASAKIQCPINFYCPASSSDPIGCPVDTTSPLGSSECVCPDGMFWSTSKCVACPRGSVCAKKPAMQCTPGFSPTGRGGASYIQDISRNSILNLNIYTFQASLLCHNDGNINSDYCGIYGGADADYSMTNDCLGMYTVDGANFAKMNLTTGHTTIYHGAQLPYRMALSPDERSAYMVLGTDNTYYRYTIPEGESAESSMQCLNGACSEFVYTVQNHLTTDIVFLLDGSHFLIADTNSVIRMDIATLSPTVVLGSTTETGNRGGIGNASRFTTIHRMIISNSKTFLIIVDSTSLYKVDLPSFNTTVLVPSLTPFAQSIAIIPDDSAVFLVQYKGLNPYNRLVLLDLATLEVTPVDYIFNDRQANPFELAICPECVPCSAGYFCNGTARTQCPKNFYCPYASATPTQCPANSLSHPGSSSMSHCICAPGTYRSALQCIDCPAGSFCSNNAIDPCPPGTDSEAKTTSYLSCKCKKGTFGTIQGPTASTCLPCAKGQFCPADQAATTVACGC